MLETFSVWFVLYHLCQAKNQGLIIPPLPPWPPMRSLAWTSAFVSPCLLPTPTPHFMVSPVPSHWVVPRVAAGSNAGGGGGEWGLGFASLPSRDHRALGSGLGRGGASAPTTTSVFLQHHAVSFLLYPRKVPVCRGPGSRLTVVPQFRKHTLAI